MSDQFSFTESGNYKSESGLDSTVLVEDGVVWDQEEVQVGLSYSNDCEATLTENNNESYLTANETSNDTQYFSVLETTNEAILNELNDIRDDSNDVQATEISEEQSGISNVCTIGGQPEIYGIEGSDELYAFEVAYDEEGNGQRFRYRLRLNENGEYEGVPESIELLPLEDDQSHASPAEVPEEEQSDDSQELSRTVKVIVKQEQESILPDIHDVSNVTEDSDDDLQVNEDEIEESDEEETVDHNEETKAGILEQNLLSINKIEAVRRYKSEEANLNFEDELLESAHDERIDEDLHSPIPHENASSVHNDQAESDDFQHICDEISDHNANEEDTDDQQDEHTYEPIINAGHFEKPFIPESDDNTVESAQSEDSEEEQIDGSNIHNMEYVDMNENESDTDDYQIVDGVHVTGDTQDASHVIETFLQRDASLSHQILKIQQQSTTAGNAKLKEMVVNNNFNKANKGFTYYVVKHPEKENAIAAHHPVTNKMVKANPRSVLKSSYLYYEQKKENEKPAAKIEKKTIKNKESMQARVFHNFIAKTTILHAPIRQQRLPRKQTIKPVERADEEIIVQEVVVSSNGFIETSEDGVIRSKVPLKPTDFVQLSDSDDDYDPKREHRRKKRQKKRKSKVAEIVISDSEEELSDENIVQIDLSADSGDEHEKRSSGKDQDSDPSDASKKKKGRPVKRPNSATDETSTSVTDGSSSSKRQRRNTKDSLESSESSGGGNAESDIQCIKTKWQCMKCPKTFPSQGSLKTHMQYHNFHESHASQSTSGFKKPESAALINKYKCSRCGESFKNNFLLTKHEKAHNSAFECSICKKIYADRAQLINHKRTHVKEQMFKATSLPKHSPKSKLPKKSDNFKCTYCTKLFTSASLLSAHARTHRRFTCTSCTSSFISKLALEDHIRHNCVKSKSPAKRLSLKTGRKSFLVPPQRVSKRISLRRASGGGVSVSGSTSSSDKERTRLTATAFLECDKCEAKFSTHKAWFSHKVIKHGLSTPDKNIGASAKKRLVHKQSSTHGSVPANERLRNAFAGKLNK